MKDPRTLILAVFMIVSTVIYGFVFRSCTEIRSCVTPPVASHEAHDDSASSPSESEEIDKAPIPQIERKTDE